MKAIFRSILKVLASWPVLAILGVVLSVVSWPWANHFVSYFWMGVFAAVLILELINKIFTDKTVSQNVQQASLNDKKRFWIMISFWILFAFTLALHFCNKLI